MHTIQINNYMYIGVIKMYLCNDHLHYTVICPHLKDPLIYFELVKNCTFAIPLISTDINIQRIDLKLIMVFIIV